MGDASIGEKIKIQQELNEIEKEEKNITEEIIDKNKKEGNTEKVELIKQEENISKAKNEINKKLSNLDPNSPEAKKLIEEKNILEQEKNTLEQNLKDASIGEKIKIQQ